MEVRLLLPLVLLHGITLFCAVNGDNMTEENIGDTQAVKPRPTTMQNITTLQCDNCPKDTKHPTTHRTTVLPTDHTTHRTTVLPTDHPTHRTTVLPTDHTTQGPSPPPSPTEYVVSGGSGVCLRIKTTFIIMLNTTKIKNVTIPSPPITEVYGRCYNDKAWLTLILPGIYLRLVFIKKMTDGVFSLESIYVYIQGKGGPMFREYAPLRTLITPLGHSFTSEIVKLRLGPKVSVLLLDVKIQAFTLEGGDYGREYIGGTQAVTPRPTTVENIKTHHATHRNAVSYIHHITQEPSPAPSPTEYILTGESGVCLRIKATFIVMLNTTKIRKVTIPSPPNPNVIGYCEDGRAGLAIFFPDGYLGLTFIENKPKRSFYLRYINIYIQGKEENILGEFEFLEALATSHGKSFIDEEKTFMVSPEVSIVLMDVKVEAFELEGGNFRRDSESMFIILDQDLSSSSIHWSVTILAPSIYTVVFLVALPLNIMAIVIFLVKMKVKKPAVVYMLNLAAADVLFVSILPFYIVYRFLGSNWVIGKGMCHFVTSAFYCNMYCSILLMTSISVDRFLAIVYPVRSLPWRTVKRAWQVCGAIWVISLASTVPLLIIDQAWKIYNLGITVCHDIQYYGVDLDFYFYNFTTLISLFFFLPLFITTFCYIRTICSLSRSKFDRTHKRSRAIRLTMIVLSVFVLCFGPTNVIYLVNYVKLYKSYDGSLYIPYILCVSISSINCCLDPLIYYFTSYEFQRYFYSFLHCKKDYCPPVQSLPLNIKCSNPRGPKETSSTKSTKSE
ncbi:uncharacterized protein LOC120933680 [Rana temporaria]|uniref:uncharacterized protein LOC120933680 n=1 Tax=Rana temporaria TaxID=8407 RepID=UPI001AACA68F|nr:uncharacterized protein LOC120933680 [Rana temporaria]